MNYMFSDYRKTFIAIIKLSIDLKDNLSAISRLHSSQQHFAYGYLAD